MKNNTIKAVIFDVDGVLLDTVPYHFKAWKKLFLDQGVRFTFQDYLQKVNGIPRLSGISNIMPNLNPKELETLADKKQSYFLKSITENSPKPLDGVVNLLKELKRRKIKIAAASSSKNAPKLLKNAGLSEYFDAVVGGHDFTRSKPDPELFLVASKKLNIDPFNCVVVEDAAAGVQAAKNANMKTIGILTSADQEIKNIADISLKSLKESETVINFISLRS